MMRFTIYLPLWGDLRLTIGEVRGVNDEMCVYRRRNFSAGLGF